jgi:hypothetical protein
MRCFPRNFPVRQPWKCALTMDMLIDPSSPELAPWKPGPLITPTWPPLSSCPVSSPCRVCLYDRANRFYRTYPRFRFSMTDNSDSDSDSDFESDIYGLNDGYDNTELLEVMAMPHPELGATCRAMYRDKAKAPPDRGLFRCQFPGCSIPPFQTQYLLNAHANGHSTTRCQYYCPVVGCPRSEGGKGFKQKDDLIKHSVHHNSSGYICPFCPDREHKYPRPENLLR